MDATALLVLNAHHDVVNFKLPEVVGGKVWRRLIDTNQPDAEGSLQVETGENYQITARSVLLFALVMEQTQGVALRRASQALQRIADAPTEVPVAPEAAPAETPEPAHAGA